MKAKLLKTACWLFIGMSALSIVYVSMLAFGNPQFVMKLVQVDLNNNDALSSIRGVYGGVGVTIVTVLLAISLRSRINGLKLLALFWGMYAISRVITIAADGALGRFGLQWLCIETGFTCISLYLLYLEVRIKSNRRTILSTTASIH